MALVCVTEYRSLAFPNSTLNWVALLCGRQVANYPECHLLGDRSLVIRWSGSFCIALTLPKTKAGLTVKLLSNTGLLPGAIAGDQQHRTPCSIRCLGDARTHSLPWYRFNHCLHGFHEVADDGRLKKNRLFVTLFGTKFGAIWKQKHCGEGVVY